MSTPSVGTQLSQARAARKLSLAEATKATKIQAWVLEALERDQLLTTMSPVYAKGFVITYAKFLGLDPAPLVALLLPAPAVEPMPEAAATAPPGDRWDAVKDGAWLIVQRGWGVALGLTAVALLVTSGPVRSLSRYTRSAHHQSANLSMVQKHQQAAMPVSPPVRLEVQPVQPLELAIVARRATWMSVKADGNLITQQKLAAGAQETWKARRRFEVVIGNPANVDVLLNGQSISPLAVAHHGRLTIMHSGITSLDEDVASLPAGTARPASAPSSDTGAAR